MTKKKLIEVALPLEKINKESAREKSIRHGHPSTLHLWWARRPLATARAVLWSSLVDDPSAHPELFPTEAEQKKERERLFGILERLVVWENTNDESVLAAAKKEILKSTDGQVPEFLDPFAGGGAIPLEAQRLGLRAHAHDLNPVAVMINKAMIEIPPRFAGLAPVAPELRSKLGTGLEGTKGAQGLAADVRAYGEWMKREAYKRIGHLYPRVKLPASQGGGEANVIAWLWARTVKCPNPACGREMPLARSFVLSKRGGYCAWVEPRYEGGKLSFTVHHEGKPKLDGTVNRRGSVCACCGEHADFAYIRNEGKAGRMSARLICVVAEGKNGRIYLPVDEGQILAAQVERPVEYPDAVLPNNPRDFKTPNYGMRTYGDLFTNRQLVALTTFSELVREAQAKAERDAVAAGMRDDRLSLASGGTGAKAYSEAVGVYLAFGLSRLTDICNALCRWEISKTQVRNLFGRQAIPMVWDYAENNVFGGAAGDYTVSLRSIIRVIERFYVTNYGKDGNAEQIDSQSDCGLRNVMVSTDPPYYDNIGYADLSDFFYVWLRQSLRETYPELFGTLLVPKAEELIATPYRHEGSKERAKAFFEQGMLATCRQIYQYAREDIPVTIYYAYKQGEADGTASSGWETMLSSIIKAGFAITGTWPMRTELANRTLASGTNALASSIVLVCRKRPLDAPMATRRGFLSALRRELRPALIKLQSSSIAPVDLAQSAIGPGMAVFSRYARVLEADGQEMSVRSALQLINEELDLYFNEQVGEMDAASRFCVELFTQCAFNELKYGEAEVLANAKGTSVAQVASRGVLYARAGMVHLVERGELPEGSIQDEGCVWLVAQRLTQAMARGGVEACAALLVYSLGTSVERAKELAYRLYTVADRKGWSAEAYAYNALVVSWQDIETRAAALRAERPEQVDLF